MNLVMDDYMLYHPLVYDNMLFYHTAWTEAEDNVYSTKLGKLLANFQSVLPQIYDIFNIH